MRKRISCIDAAVSGVTPEDLLLKHKSPLLHELFRSAEQRYGWPAEKVLAMGFLKDMSTVDFSPASRAPQMVLLRHLLLQIASISAVSLRRFAEQARLAQEAAAEAAEDDE